jgi:hypothetical protein
MSTTDLRPARTAAALGFVLGLGIAFAFALVFRLVPPSWLEDTGPRVVLYVLMVVTAPVVVLPLRTVASRARLDATTFVWAALGGALLFDGTALGFASSLYGQTGLALTYVGTVLLFAFGCQVLTQLLVPSRSAVAG